MIFKGKYNWLLSSLLIFLWLSFIWGNSLQTGEESGNISGGALDFLGQFIPLFSPENPNGHLLLRKLAHFSEFAILGILLCWNSAIHHRKSLHIVLSAFCLGVSAAAIDEGIQRFVPGRHGCITDVLIDSGGVLFGVGLLMLLIVLVQKYRKGGF